MSESKKCFDLSLLKDNFTNIKKGFRPAAMLKIGNCGDENRDICSLAFVCKELNFGAIAPFWTQKSVPAYGSEGYYSAYSSLLSSLEKEGMTAVFCDDCDFPSGWAGVSFAKNIPNTPPNTLKDMSTPAQRVIALNTVSKRQAKLCRSLLLRRIQTIS